MNENIREQIIREMNFYLNDNLLQKFYPLVIDKEFGGYFSNAAYNWELCAEQEKMIVTQARHIWTSSKAAGFYPANTVFRTAAEHGLDFLMHKMWDSQYGGFYQIRGREGRETETAGWLDQKRMYGNAFAVYGLAALYNLTKEEKNLGYAKQAFNWIEKYFYDPQYKGYFQFMTRDLKIFDKSSGIKVNAVDAIEVGYKDQNSSIHLLEAYTELYKVWKDELLKEKLIGLLELIRDVQTHPKGYLQLFFERDWTPVSFSNAPKEIREQYYQIDHISFGHDYETAFLMLEASFAAGLKNDPKTLITAKIMLDHAIENGWDKNSAGFFDEGYYFEESGKCQIIKDTKTWWAQAEGMNVLLLFSKIFPEEKRYEEMFLKLWEYIKEYLIDKENGGWYWGSLEKEPEMKYYTKSNIWQCAYHNSRALMNCIVMLANDNEINSIFNGSIKILKEENEHFLNHWRKTAKETVNNF